MKYIAAPTLQELSRTLSHSSTECTVHTRIEAYSCKPIGKDKKLWKQIDGQYEDETAAPLLSSPFGSLDTPAARRTFCLLIATLNVAFPDHDFSDVSPDHFRHEEASAGAAVLAALSTTLMSLRASDGGHAASARSYSSFPAQASGDSDEFFPSSPSSSPERSSVLSTLKSRGGAIAASTHPTLFRILNDVVTLSECQVFSYSPDIYSDPHAGDDSDCSDSDSESDAEDSDDEFGDSDYDESNEHWDNDSFGSKAATSWDDKSIFTFEDDPKLSSSPARSPSFMPKQPPHKAARRRGALLWSTHYFFHHKKEKKILFITVWARRRSTGWRRDSYAEEEETFVGWKDDVGAGARAFGVEPKAIKAGPKHAKKTAGTKAPETFVGWKGAVGAGKRAFELASSHNIRIKV